jgi:predicted alpha/beta hydrolase
MSARNTEALLGFYRSAKQHIKRIDPREIGVERIGHFGFFNPRFEHTLWREHLLPELQD